MCSKREKKRRKSPPPWWGSRRGRGSLGAPEGGAHPPLDWHPWRACGHHPDHFLVCSWRSPCSSLGKAQPFLPGCGNAITPCGPRPGHVGGQSVPADAWPARVTFLPRKHQAGSSRKEIKIPGQRSGVPSQHRVRAWIRILATSIWGRPQHQLSLHSLFPSGTRWFSLEIKNLKHETKKKKAVLVSPETFWTLLSGTCQMAQAPPHQLI